jgi:methionyl-tRNA synthetase
MIAKYCNYKVPRFQKASLSEEQHSFHQDILSKVPQVSTLISECHLFEALKIIMQLISNGNKFIEQTSPWLMHKEHQLILLDNTLNLLIQLL